VTKPTPAVLRGNFVMLRAGTLRLLLPQSEVGAAEYLEERPQPAGEPGLLSLPHDAGGRSFAALTDRMTLHRACPDERFVVTTLGDGGDEFGWCWDELKVLIDIELQPRPLPAALVTPFTPVDGYVEFEGKLVFLCTASRLASFALGAGVES
jgi:hypothetical protein